MIAAMRSQIPECSFACIITGRSFDFRRGKLEVRACLSTRGRGRRPLLGGSARDKSSYAPWPACGEIGAMDFCRIIGVAKILANFAREGEKTGVSVWDDKKCPCRIFPPKTRTGLSIPMCGAWTGAGSRAAYVPTAGFSTRCRLANLWTEAGAKGYPFLKPQYLPPNPAIGNPPHGNVPVGGAAMPRHESVRAPAGFRDCRSRPKTDTRPPPLQKFRFRPRAPFPPSASVWRRRSFCRRTS